MQVKSLIEAEKKIILARENTYSALDTMRAMSIPSEVLISLVPINTWNSRLE